MQLRLVDIVIGLVATFFLLALIGSALVEAVSMIFKKRSKDLEVVIGKMLADGNVATTLGGTSVFEAINAATRRKRGPKDDARFPSYVSASSFVEAIVEAKKLGEGVDDAISRLPDSPLKKRLQALVADSGDDLTKIKAGLESWFDEAMDRLSGAYKRWSQWFLLIFGLALVVGLNVSAVRIVDNLWNDSTLRAAVAEQAVGLTESQCPTDKGEDCTPAERIETAIGSLDALKLPIGWGDSRWTPTVLGTVLGWLITGATVMLGAPFWFDALKRLAGLRGGRGVPPRAVDDPSSATSAMRNPSPS